MRDKVTMSLVVKLAMASAVLMMAMAACGGPQKLEPRAMPPGATFNGKWYSPQYENMELKQAGTKVTGTFSYKNGSLEGTLEGGILYFEWTQPGDMSKAVREVRGTGYFIMGADGESFEGRWGYGDDNADGGVWTADRIESKGPKEDFDAPIF